MTEQLDTAAIRAEYEDGADVLWVDVLALCNALDAARTERDGYRAMIRPENVWRARAEAAEARIAAALELHPARSNQWGPVICPICDPVDAVPGPCSTRRALTEGTGQ